jgi:hypothetical protein
MKHGAGGRAGKRHVFDPYHVWLGIAEGRRPCSHYELLGIPPGELNAGVIEAAAVARLSQVRCYQLAYEEECTRLLTEIALALDTLVDPVKRREYDAKLERVPPAPAGEAPFGRGEAPPAPAGLRATQARVAPGESTQDRGRACTARQQRALAPEVVLEPAPVRRMATARCDVVLRVRRLIA